MEHEHEVKYFEFLFSEESRKFYNQEPIKIMQGDHNSNIFKFHIPKVVQGHDMSQCTSIKVNYINIGANGATSEDVYSIKDAAVNAEDANVLDMTWVLSGSTSKYDGILAFQIHFKCMEDEEVVYAWHTESFKLPVEKSINSSDAVYEENSDVLLAWEARMETLLEEIRRGGLDGGYYKPEVDEEGNLSWEASQEDMPEIAGSNIKGPKGDAPVKGVDYFTPLEMSRFAPAISNSASGSTIVLADSSEQALDSLKIFGHSEKDYSGKNLFDVNRIPTNYGETVVNNGDGTITVDGSFESIGTLGYLCPRLKVGDEFTITFNVDNGGSILQYFDNEQSYIESGQSYVATAQMLINQCLISGSTSTFSNIQVELGTEATEYEPYNGSPIAQIRSNGDSGSITILLDGGNFLKPISERKIVTDLENDRYTLRNLDGNSIYIGLNYYNLFDSREITYEYNATFDSLSVKTRTVGYGVGIDCKVKPNTDYNLSFEDGTGGNTRVLFYTSEGLYLDSTNNIGSAGATFKTPDGCYYAVILFAPSSTSTQVAYSKYQLSLGTVIKEYEEYQNQKQFIVLTPDGLPSVPVTDAEPSNYTDVTGQRCMASYLEINTADGTGKIYDYIFKKTFTGDEEWNTGTSLTFRAVGVLPEVMKARSGYCTNYDVVDSYKKAGVSFGSNNNDIYFGKNPYYDRTLPDKGVSNWNAYLRENPLTVMTYVTTPTITDLSAEEVQAFLELYSNYPTTVITNSDDAYMEVGYKADTRSYIDRKYDELKAMIVNTQAQLL